MSVPPLLRESVAFDPPAGKDTLGGRGAGWDVDARYLARARFAYMSGGEGVEAAREAGRARFKVRIRSTARAREITPRWRMRQVRQGLFFDVVEVDMISDPAWVWIVAEGPVPSA